MWHGEILFFDKSGNVFRICSHVDTLRNNDVVITSKRRNFDVITSNDVLKLWRRYYYVMCSVGISIQDVSTHSPISRCILCMGSSLHWRHAQWSRWRLKSPASRLFTQSFIQTQMTENIKAPRHWPLCWEFTGTGEFPAQKASNAENVSIWWPHHVCIFLCVPWKTAIKIYHH